MRVLFACLLACGAAAATASCGGDDSSQQTSGNDAGDRPDTSTTNPDGSSAMDSSSPDTSTPMDSGSAQDSGFVPTCSAPSVKSSCSNPLSIVTAVVELGGGMMDATGNLVVSLNHYRLGSGATGGVYHISTTKNAVTVGSSKPVEVQFDMCLGGEMWSEDNCEFNLFAYVDVNKNGMLDSGEPAGRVLTNVSCKALAPDCVGIVLDCTAGASCIGFTDPGGCTCTKPSCGSSSKIVTCS